MKIRVTPEDETKSEVVSIWSCSKFCRTLSAVTLYTYYLGEANTVFYRASEELLSSRKQQM